MIALSNSLNHNDIAVCETTYTLDDGDGEDIDYETQRLAHSNPKYADGQTNTEAKHTSLVC